MRATVMKGMDSSQSNSLTGKQTAVNCRIVGSNPASRTRALRKDADGKTEPTVWIIYSQGIALVVKRRLVQDRRTVRNFFSMKRRLFPDTIVTEQQTSMGIRTPPCRL